MNGSSKNDLYRADEGYVAGAAEALLAGGVGDVGGAGGHIWPWSDDKRVVKR
jgi:hypothetical protein